jgi:hypothetical protein
MGHCKSNDNNSGAASLPSVRVLEINNDNYIDKNML